jgi:hypothetical protein
MQFIDGLCFLPGVLSCSCSCSWMVHACCLMPGWCAQLAADSPRRLPGTPPAFPLRVPLQAPGTRRLPASHLQDGPARNAALDVIHLAAWPVDVKGSNDNHLQQQQGWV